jgi:hypothetical protein
MTAGGAAGPARERPGHYINPGEVQPGMFVRNPYGGRRGLAEAASEPRVREDGIVEIDMVDGRTGRFHPDFPLQLVREPEPSGLKPRPGWDAGPAETRDWDGGPAVVHARGGRDPEPEAGA